MKKLLFILVLVFILSAFAKSEKSKSLAKKYPKLRGVFASLIKLKKSNQKRIEFSNKKVDESQKKVALLEKKTKKAQELINLTTQNLKTQKETLKQLKVASVENSKQLKAATAVHAKAKNALLRATTFLKVEQQKLKALIKKQKEESIALNAEIVTYTKLVDLLGKQRSMCKAVKVNSHCSRLKCCGFKKSGKKWKKVCIYKKKVCKKVKKTK
jgi:chromosome segregation ATPase